MSSSFVGMIPFVGPKLSDLGSDLVRGIFQGDHEVRDDYNDKVNEAYQAFIKEAAVFHDADQCFGEDLARKATDTRNKIKVQHQAKTSVFGMVGVWWHNLLKYAGGGATYEKLAKTKNPEEIAYSAFKTGGGDLGLANNGFGDVVDTWNAIKGVSTLYPEDITPAMIEAFKAMPAGKVDPAMILAARTAVVVTGDDVPAVRVGDDVPAETPPRAKARPLIDADVEMILAARPVAPDFISKDELMSSLIQQGPTRRFAAYI